MNAIEIQHLSKSFPNFELKDVSFSLPSGMIMGFIGENGAGKTTTIKCLLNILKKDSGEIRIFGLDGVEEDQKIKQDIGVVFDDLLFPEVFTAKHIHQVMKKMYMNWDKDLYFALLKKLNVPTTKVIKEFSRGMKMKLSIIIALSHHPKLLILDEPTSGLDPIVRDEILDLFLEFMQDDEHSILFSSHITSDLEKIADYITFVHDGRIVFSENKDTLLYDYGIWKGTKEAALELPEDGIVRVMDHPFGVQMLVKRDLVSPSFELEKPTIEEIMLFYVKGEKVNDRSFA